MDHDPMLIEEADDYDPMLIEETPDLPQPDEYEERLGRGGFGEVWLVRQGNKRYALKIIDLNRIDQETLENEVEILRYIKPKCHKYLLCFDKFVQQGHFAYLFTEFLEGYEPVQRIVLRRQVDLPDLAPLVYGMAKGLNWLHCQNVVHNDIKPENIMWNPVTKQVKYIDFGASCMLLCSNIIASTYSYVSPEGFSLWQPDFPLLEGITTNRSLENRKGNLLILKQSDIWSLGISIYQIIAKEVPLKIIYHDEDTPITYDMIIRYFRDYRYLQSGDHRTLQVDRLVDDSMGQINKILSDQGIKERISLSGMLEFDWVDRHIFSEADV